MRDNMRTVRGIKIENAPGLGVTAGLAVLLAALVVLAPCASCVSTTPMLKQGGTLRTPPEELASTYFVSTTCMDVGSLGGELQGGSGVMVDAHHLLTARHVVACSTGALPLIYVRNAAGDSYPALVQQEWSEKDVALIYVQRTLPGVQARFGARPRRGDSVCVHVAYPSFGAACGDVSAIAPDSPASDVTVEIPIQHGNSGGGVYFDGALVGIVTRLLPCPFDTSRSCGGTFSSLAGMP